MSASASAWALSALLGASGVLHFVAPRPYEAIVPRSLGAPGPWVRGSGVVELACAAAVVAAPTRRWGALASAALLVAVFPANVRMALDSGRPGRRGLAGNPVLAWGRLPLQVPLVLWALDVARRS